MYTNITKKQIANNKVWIASEVEDGSRDRLVVWVGCKSNQSRRWEQSSFESKADFLDRVKHALSLAGALNP